MRGFVPEAFAYLYEGAFPFAFPVKAKSTAKLLGWLYQRGIVASNFWSVPHPSLKVTDFPKAAELRGCVVALPVHQELRSEELERIVDAVLSGPEWEGCLARWLECLDFARGD